jgi:hypothetical protein
MLYVLTGVVVTAVAAIAASGCCWHCWCCCARIRSGVGEEKESRSGARSQKAGGSPDLAYHLPQVVRAVRCTGIDSDTVMEDIVTTASLKARTQFLGRALNDILVIKSCEEPKLGGEQ